MDSSIIHDNIYSLIHKKSCTKSYHSDIKYHMTLNIIYSVAVDSPHSLSPRPEARGWILTEFMICNILECCCTLGLQFKILIVFEILNGTSYLHMHVSFEG